MRISVVANLCCPSYTSIEPFEATTIIAPRKYSSAPCVIAPLRSFRRSSTCSFRHAYDRWFVGTRKFFLVLRILPSVSEPNIMFAIVLERESPHRNNTSDRQVPLVPLLETWDTTNFSSRSMRKITLFWRTLAIANKKGKPFTAGDRGSTPSPAHIVLPIFALQYITHIESTQ